jgi:hypothetical protein
MAAAPVFLAEKRQESYGMAGSGSDPSVTKCDTRWVTVSAQKPSRISTADNGELPQNAPSFPALKR